MTKEELITKRDQLIDRLDAGSARIQQARSSGVDVETWEDYWLKLLKNYEQVCDQINALANPVLEIVQPEKPAEWWAGVNV